MFCHAYVILRVQVGLLQMNMALVHLHWIVHVRQSCVSFVYVTARRHAVKYNAIHE